MKKILLATICFPIITFSQICNPTGNIMLFSNYDGGTLNINIDQDIPNLKIGVVTYEGVTINLSGTFVNNVTEVYYAGYNANNTNCGSVINTSINGAPGTAITSINLYPPATLANANGNGNIICAYSCDITTSQGGCNTVDQVEDFFIVEFGGSVFAHYVQYGCWSGPYNLSAGGICCPVIPLSATSSGIDNNCFNICDGSATATANGGTDPYTYSWSNGENGSTIIGLCGGTYTVTITDNVGATTTQSVTLTQPIEISATFVNTVESVLCDGTSNVSASGGTPGFTYLWEASANNQNSQLATNLCEGIHCVLITDDLGCFITECTSISSVVGIEELSNSTKQLIRIIDLIGRETEFKPNTVLIYIYNDGSHERILVVQ